MAESDVGFRIEVTGVADAIKLVGKFDPDLKKQIVKDMKGYAQPMVADARGRLPAKPLTNWYGWRGGYELAKAKRGINVSVRTGKVRGASRDTIPLVTLRQTNAAGAIFDMAGRTFPGRGSEGAARGAAMVQKLNSFGHASRTLWPAAEAHTGAVESGLEQIAETVSTALTNELKAP